MPPWHATVLTTIPIEHRRLRDGQPHLRRKKFLVIEGPSGVGAKEFIKQLAGPERTLEISADGMTSPYLRNFTEANRPDAIRFNYGVSSDNLLVDAYKK